MFIYLHKNLKKESNKKISHNTSTKFMYLLGERKQCPCNFFENKNGKMKDGKKRIKEVSMKLDIKNVKRERKGKMEGKKSKNKIYKDTKEHKKTLHTCFRRFPPLGAA